MVTEYLHAVFNRILLLNFLQLLYRFDENIMEIFNGYLVISTVLYKVLFAFHNHFYERIIIRSLSLNEVFEELKEESPVETVAVSSKSPYFFVSGIKRTEAVL